MKKNNVLNQFPNVVSNDNTPKLTENQVADNPCFTTVGRGHGAPCSPANCSDWEQMRREPWLKEMCERIENGEEELKHKLPVWTPSCAEFRNNHRAIADALKPLPRLMMDFDEKGHTGDILSKLRVHSSECIVGDAPELGGMTILLVEESVRRGTHVLVELPEGMTPDEAQRLMAEATGFEPDKAVKDVSRCIYMVPEDHTRYISDKLFNVGTDFTDLHGLNNSAEESRGLKISAEEEKISVNPHSMLNS